MAAIDALYNEVHDAADPGLWSRGVSLARDGAVHVDAVKTDEIQLRVATKDRPIAPKVTLWPEDSEWHCDCRGRIDPCFHVAAAVIAIKNDQASLPDDRASKNSREAIEYAFKRDGRDLRLERYVVRSGSRELLRGSLVSLSAGIGSGRISEKSITATREDFAVDQALSESAKRARAMGSSAPPDRTALGTILRSLDDCPHVTLDGTTIRVSARPVTLKARVTDERDGARLARHWDSNVKETFRNGAAMTGNEVPELRPVDIPELDAQARSYLSGEGSFFPKAELPRLFGELVPRLLESMEIENLSSRAPEVKEMPPRLVLHMERVSDELVVTPRIVYGDPAIAEIRGGKLESLRAGPVPLRDSVAEHQIARELLRDLNLQLERPTRLPPQKAMAFVKDTSAYRNTGAGAAAFTPVESLQISMDFVVGGFDLSFKDPTGERRADAATVLRGWRENHTHVPLLGGGWAKIPDGWLSQNAERLEAMLTAKELAQSEARGSVPAWMVPEIADFGADIGAQLPESLKSLGKALIEHKGIPEAALPDDLDATLREYQRKGIDWLSFLRDQGLGAILADDMGLGKTLQALCAIRGKTLVVCPTSVLQSWAEQARRFRPGLKVSVYYGPYRALDSEADLTITSYALLRIDLERLSSWKWQTLILDEAQTIRNPTSQVAKAAHAIQAPFRIALSGTPLENRLEDLWSIFRFAVPGLLGSLLDFKDRYSRPIAQGEAEPAARLRRMIRPFLLRRLKREVAPELPPRTETVLHAELGDEERKVYETVLAGAKSEILEKLGRGESVFTVLELLLRLRQACCHPALVPGTGETARTSAKIDLLADSLETAASEGHRALVFSQWTSFLDLIEPVLSERGLKYLRLDGSTPDRGRIVSDFQTENGPPVLLMSLKAGGVGLTLTAADQVFLMDPWWNPAAEDQAADRAHRIGQTNPVVIHRLVAKDTIEERVLALQQTKRNLAEGVLSESAGSLALTADDIRGLLA